MPFCLSVCMNTQQSERTRAFQVQRPIYVPNLISNTPLYTYTRTRAQPNVRLRNELRHKYPALYQLRLDTVAKEFEVCMHVCICV